KTKRCDLLLALAEALMPAGEPMRAVEEVAEQSLALAEVMEDRQRSSRACRLAIAGLHRNGIQTMSGTRIYGQWAERADRHALPNSSDRVYADIALANVRHAGGRFGEAAALYDSALGLAMDLDEPEALALAAGRRISSAVGSPGRQEQRFKLVEELSRRPRDGMSARTQGELLFSSVMTYLDWGERGRAEEMLRQLTELSGRTQDPDPSLRVLTIEGQLLKLDGGLEAAVEAGERLVTRADEVGAPVLGRQFRSPLVLRPLLYLGRGEEALSTLPQAAQTPGGEEAAFVAVRRALCLAHLGRTEEARSVFRLLVTQLVVGPGEDEMPMHILCELLQTAVLVEDLEMARLLAQRLSKVALILSGPQFTCIARDLGAAAALLGDKEKARAYYQQALEVRAKVRHRPEAALTHLQLAELLLQGAGEQVVSRKEAMEHLDFAIGEFTEMKMQPSLERALRHKGFLKA
ncbi:MAG: hypothetical protein EXR50_00460, partial [Dehalococcoidia bacterium]|nr:hypothetical protein [Dehalococcoidia bacterium]